MRREKGENLTKVTSNVTIVKSGGHFADVCYFNNNRRNSRSDEEKFAKDDDEAEQVLLMVTTREDNTAANYRYLDTGCSIDMTGRKDWFVNCDESIKCKVKFADNNTLTAAGLGKVLIKRTDGQHSFISDVLICS